MDYEYLEVRNFQSHHKIHVSQSAGEHVCTAVFVISNLELDLQTRQDRYPPAKSVKPVTQKFPCRHI